jgi:hypothetical protein
MNSFKKLCAFCISVMLCVGISPVYAAKVSLSAKSLSLTVGQTKTLKVKGTKKKVTWKTKKKTIATISSKGVVKAKKVGITTITAKVSGKTYSCKVKVKAKAKTPYISPKTVSLSVGSKKLLKLLYNKKKVKWSSTNKKIVMVTSKGKITAVKVGRAYVKAKVGSKTYKRKVTVTKVKTNKKSMIVGETKTLSSATKDTYKSSNTSIVSVAKGKATACNPGTCTITEKGETARKWRITVAALSLSQSSLSLNVGHTATLTVANNKAAVTWSTDHSDIATVNNGVVTAVASGTAVISAKINATTLTCSVTVNGGTVNSVKARTSPYTSSRTQYKAGIVGQIIKASDMINSSTNGYVSSDNSVALVSKSGYVMPLKAGSVTITNKSNNQTLTITVSDPGNVEYGADVSYHNGNVDMAKLKNAGCDFVIIRGGNTLKKLSTTNSDGIDLNLKTNIDQAEAAGLNYGIYWYMNSSDNKGLMTTDEADAQAVNLANYLNQYKTSHFTLPIYLDLEQSSALLSGRTNAQKTAYIEALVEHFSATLAAYGYKDVGLYTSTSWYKHYLQSDSLINGYTSRWQAHYQYNSAQLTHTITPSFTYNGVTYYPDLWQTGSDFTIDGVSGNVDMNYRYL